MTQDALPPEGSRVTDTLLEEEMKDSYLRYAMSVIVARALPDVRDGLKPSQRRILMAMHDLNAGPRSRRIKCASIVGETMKKYHPHGDQAIYPTLVRLAQSWSTRYELIEPQGNFGSLDGDPPAAMRYTEARLRASAVDMLEDLDKETVDFQPNFDDSDVEPTVLPCKFPNLLVNGSQGIAVGMATSIPPHNLREIAAALAALIDRPAATVDDLLEHVQGPDFPTGGVICGRSGIVEAYRTGRGKVVVRGIASITETKTGGTELVISELPYQVNKKTLVEKIAQLVKDEVVDGITHVNDESGRLETVRVVVQLRRDASPHVVLNQLFAHTQLESTFSIMMIALVEGRPETLDLKQLLERFLEHRREVIRRRTSFLLRKAEERKHILEGLRIAVDHIDEVIAIIRGAPSPDEARTTLERRFGLSERQADAILNMQLRRLTGLERDKLESEYKEVLDQIADFRDILDRRERVDAMIKDDLADAVKRYGDDRRSRIGPPVEGVEDEDLIPEQFMVVTLSNGGYIKRTPLSTYRAQNRGGKGVYGQTTKEDDFMSDLFIAHSHATLLFFTNLGRVYANRVFQLPEGSRTSKGRAMANVLPLMENERVEICLPIRNIAESTEDLLFVTERGKVKKTSAEKYARILQRGIVAISLDPGDRLIDVRPVGAEDEVFIGTRNGRAIRFHSRGVRSMGRNARGVRGISLREGDLVVGVAVRLAGAMLLTICEYGYGKQTDFDAYRETRRGGIGVINIKTSERNGKVVALLAVKPEDDLVVISQQGSVIRMAVSDIRETGRVAQGVRIMNLEEQDRIVSAAVSPKEEISDEEEMSARQTQTGEFPAAPAASGAEVEDDAEDDEEEVEDEEDEGEVDEPDEE